MAGNSQRDAIGGAGARHGAGRGGLSKLSGELRIGPGLARRDLLKRAPHFLLEGSAAQIEWDGLPAFSGREMLQRRDGGGENLGRGSMRLWHFDFLTK